MRVQRNAGRHLQRGGRVLSRCLERCWLRTRCGLGGGLWMDYLLECFPRLVLAVLFRLQPDSLIFEPLKGHRYCYRRERQCCSRRQLHPKSSSDLHQQRRLRVGFEDLPEYPYEPRFVIDVCAAERADDVYHSLCAALPGRSGDSYRLASVHANGLTGSQDL